jgi:cobalt-zinc-cadmium efflux system membrane fusion protein
MRNLSVVAALLLVLAGFASCSRQESREGHAEEGAHAEDSHEETARGPRGGKLFRDGGVGVELLIAEEGIEPEYRAYLYDQEGRALSADGARLRALLERFGGRRDSVEFVAEGDRLRSTGPIREPHSYRASFVLERAGKRHAWSFEQVEGRVVLSPEAVANAGLRVATAGPRYIGVTVEAPGEVRLNVERVTQVRPRFPGVVRSVEKRLGDEVAAGDLLAVIHSNESLSDYELRAPMKGTVVARDASPGQSVDHEDILLTIADLSSVWVDCALYPQIAPLVRPGQSAMVRSASGTSLQSAGTITYVGPLLEQDTRVSYGRIVLSNSPRRWQPGLHVNVEITVERARVGVAVPDEALVRMEGGTGVFRSSGSSFELQPVTTGRSDGAWTEVVEGLEPGATVVGRNAYLLKAELGKSEATHDH